MADRILDLTLNCVSPWDKNKPHKPMQRLLELDLVSNTLKRVHLVAGRGSGKSVGTVLLATKTALTEAGTRGAVLAPSFDNVDKVFLRHWADIVPERLYEYQKAARTIQLINGSTIYLRSRHIDNPSRGKETSRGLDINWVIDDEAALGFSMEQYTNVSACARRAGKQRFYACMTTPRLNDYYALATSPGHTLIEATTYDNPHLPPDYVHDLQASMSSQQAEREIFARWVALEGLVWSNFSRKDWPAGNVHPHKFTKGRPWWLFMDLGVGSGAYLVVQNVDARVAGQQLFPGGVWVVVAEIMPTSDGSASKALQPLKKNFGLPTTVVTGHDVNVRSDGDGTPPMYFVRKVFGSVPVVPIEGWRADKQIQHDSAQYLICSATGGRRFCVSKELVELGDTRGKRKRGILQMLEQDTWPENAGRMREIFFNKDGFLEHARDAFLYGSVGLMNPPKFVSDGRMAA